jgi:hypothetical protein
MTLRLNTFGVHILAISWRLSKRLQPKNNVDILLAQSENLLDKASLWLSTDEWLKLKCTFGTLCSSASRYLKSL